MARRGGPELADLLSFGGRVPPAAGGLVTLLVVLFLVDNLGGGAASAWLALHPRLVMEGEIWRLVTWSVLESQPIGLIFAALWIWQTGGQLAGRWGTRRFLGVWVGLSAGAGVTQVLASFVWDSAGIAQGTPWPILVALLLMWALANPNAHMSWFGMLPMNMRTLAWSLLGGTVLFAIASPVRGTFVTNFAALAIAYVLSGPGFPIRRWWYRFRAELQVRRSRRRAEKSRLKVVSRNGDGDRPKWMN
jgi:membrane associated rhomboid family serine protease